MALALQASFDFRSADRTPAAIVAAGGVCFVRADPPRTCRAYWLLVQPNLWGGVDLVQVWGRWGVQQRRPRRRVCSYGSLAVLEGRLAEQLDRRLRRGYLPRELVA